MLMQPTIDKLYSMKLTGMAEAIRRQMEDPEASRLSFEERLALLVDQQWDWRQNKAFVRRLKNARFKTGAAVEDIDYRHPRRLDRQLIRSLSACDWVRHHQNLIVTGPCGVGKSFIAGALAQKAVREGFTSLYVRAPRLFRDLAVARADGSFGTLLDRIARIDVFLVDDWAMAPLADSERRDFLEICDDRYSDTLHDSHQSGAGRSMARSNRGSHHRRQHPGPSGPQCSPHRTPGRFDAEVEKRQTAPMEATSNDYTGISPPEQKLGIQQIGHHAQRRL